MPLTCHIFLYYVMKCQDIAVIKNSVMDLQSQVKALSASLSAISNQRLYDDMFPPMPLSSSSSFVVHDARSLLPQICAFDFVFSLVVLETIAWLGQKTCKRRRRTHSLS